jgi:hypothetical protein
MMTMSIGAFLIELTVAKLLPVSAELCLVVHAEIFYVPQHLLARLKIHLLLGSISFTILCQILRSHRWLSELHRFLWHHSRLELLHQTEVGWGEGRELG